MAVKMIHFEIRMSCFIVVTSKMPNLLIFYTYIFDVSEHYARCTLKKKKTSRLVIFLKI